MRRITQTTLERHRAMTEFNEPANRRQEKIASSAAIAAGWGDTSPALPAIVASNLKFIRKNTLIATADLTIPRWRLVIRGAMWFEKNGKEWIALPSREWVDQNGDKKYATIIEFSDRETADRFQIAALNA